MDAQLRIKADATRLVFESKDSLYDYLHSLRIQSSGWEQYSGNPLVEFYDDSGESVVFDGYDDLPSEDLIVEGKCFLKINNA